MSHDIVIRNGRIIDGSGAAAIEGDIAVSDGLIAEVGTVSGRGKREIDAAGRVVSPGFIDGHTHMDAQIHWDPLGSCSCWHGVTSVVMGNCGFTLAPVRPDTRELLVRNLERAEDISAASMRAGIEWTWNDFPEYLDVLDGLPKGINHAANVGHSALRTWAMGERAFDGAATEDDLRAMEGQLRAALAAGAVGFTTTMAESHEMSDGRPVASRFADWEETRRLAAIVGESGNGVFELAPPSQWISEDLAARGLVKQRLRELAIDHKVTVTVPVIAGRIPEDTWRDHLAFIAGVNAEGGRMFGQTHPRGVTILLSFLGQLPFDRLPEWSRLRARPIAEQKQALRDPVLRARLVDEAHNGTYGRTIGSEAQAPSWDRIFLFDRPFPPYPNMLDVARERGQDVVEAMIDLALESDFQQNFIQYSGAVPRDEDLVALMSDPHVVTTFSDTGAHVSQISDSALHPYFIGLWSRIHGRFGLEQAVRMVTAVPAEKWGIAGRGRLKPGWHADINVFDPEQLTPGLPRMVHDLPGGSKRFVNKTAGIAATLVNGEVFMENGEHTGALAGRLLRRAAA